MGKTGDDGFRFTLPVGYQFSGARLHKRLLGRRLQSFWSIYFHPCEVETESNCIVAGLIKQVNSFMNFIKPVRAGEYAIVIQNNAYYDFGVDF